MTNLLDMTTAQLRREFRTLRDETMDILPVTAEEFTRAAQDEMFELGLPESPLAWVLAARNVKRRAGPKAFHSMECVENQNLGCEGE